MSMKQDPRGQDRDRNSREHSFSCQPRKPFVWLVYVWLIFAGIGVIITLLPEAHRSFLVPSRNWEANGGFFANYSPAEHQLPRSYLLDTQNIFWRSWSPETLDSIGRIQSKPFSTDAWAISLPVIGYPNAPGNDLYIKNTESGERMSLRYGNAHEVWQELIVSIPSSWHSKPLVVGAESRAGLAYVGLGPPAGVSWTTIAKRSLPVLMAWHLGTCALLIFLAAPLQSIMAAILQRSLPGECWRWILFPLALALIGYVTFFGLYFLPLTTWCILLFSVIIGALLCKRGISKVLRSPAAFLARRPIVVPLDASVGHRAYYTIRPDYGVLSICCELPIQSRKLVHGQPTSCYDR